MEERLYNKMGAAGAAALAAGIVMAVIGVAAGVVAIVSGAQMLANRKHITF
ncbi:MAG: hypothetical protein IJ468_05995 [Lachnospiraceae bacterium]|nr:hypothetical protein [Lachnospiraceae bacterium]